ncbi:hypothetical protein BBO99_00002512 [Phytophthora kernoviae]|uniref:Pentatricopeptide repeat-containing protein-mitochondrial domain-containing protein n=2 Tax=Phytophthora kernoviae TaxID=325452 RepID=A0A421FBD7_9STRA|nr:hypothetical protein G195_002888 [Phytophthora kernoviae 00238/432]KAG2525107.1 hypothetical protein JM16_004682 [Phytophthora kernoviae]KAG2530612.1 hypothetical protein JM18_002048 [Phytophthora kernoviae]RLN36804.1 hypothetical protein BBI17_002396 [Phytophthora kernoviae]RLN82946.1 hypothetical protein BBO99_00002512 [Phytophthora kernoviae]
MPVDERDARMLPVAARFKRHVVCCAMARKGQKDRALETMKELSERFGEEFQEASTIYWGIYDPLLSVFKTQGDWRSTHTAIGQMNELGIKPSLRSFRVLMLTAAKAQRKDTLLSTIAFVKEKFPEVWTDVATLTAMCQAFVEIGEPERAMKIYQKLDADWLQENANTRLYNQLLLAAIRSSDAAPKAGKSGNRIKKQKEIPMGIQAATRIFEQMQTAQNAPLDDFTFATYLLGLEKRDRWEQAIELFDTMLDIQTRNESASSVEPEKPVINALACSTVIRALHKLSEANQSEQSDPEPQKNASKAYSKSSKKLSPQQTKLKKDLAIVLKQFPTIDLTSIGHASTLIDTLDEFKLLTPAREVFQRMLDEGVIKETPWRQKDGFEIDLHTFSRGVAKCAVVSAFEEITASQSGTSEASLPGNAPLENLRIITGVGNRSQVFLKPVLKQEISEMLSKACRPPLWPSTHPTNPGVLIVKRNRLRNWIQKGGVIRYF